MLHFRKTLRWVLISVGATVLSLLIMSQFPNMAIPARYWIAAVLLPAVISYFVSRKLIQQTEDLAVLNAALMEANATLTSKLRAENLLNMAFSTISQGCSIYDENDCLVFCNDAYREIYSLSATAILPGRCFGSMLRHGLEVGQYPEAGTTPEDQEAWLQKRMGRHRNPTGPFLQKIGPDSWIQVEEYVTKENYRIGLLTDVSALLQVKSEAEQLGHIIEAVAQEVYLISTADGRIVNANKAARTNLQYSLEELRGLTALDVNSGHSSLEMAETIAPIVAGERKVVKINTEHRRKDGTTYKCRVRLERLDDLSETVVVAFAEDVTERLEFEHAIERKQQELETLVRNLPDVISRAEPDTTLTYVNANYAEFTGVPVEDMIGCKFLEFSPTENLDELTSHIESLTPEQPIRLIEQPMYNSSGEKRWYLWSNLMVFDEGEPVELVSVGRDITESRKAQERIAKQTRELALRNDALEQFGGIISHDLKAPLRQIRVFSEMIKEDIELGKTDELANWSSHVVNRARSMEQMISSLFAYSRLAYQSVHLEKFLLSEAISAAWENLSVSVADSRAQLVDRCDLMVTADINLMTQLLQNMFANSIKYTEDGVAPQIRVSAETVGCATVIVVEDNGIGIATVHAESIFGVFERLHPDETRYAGAGIGLALCRRVVESHGGTIALDSSYVDGARFVIRLPALSL
ncbi:PAS domain S-box [Hoeflea phototrophica DFL-43]|jgi:PAS domain S-box-containing protein|uniref:histidine kinase n=1 Tax=Hoeflea phototrophica (strain DSM 17068 / NCIMB 14078 / DFL-43) TaxID=411684 RepID=A9D9Y5_HOEPD|nr:PAS domain S-box protein [Hoeflea phototrophica]EDQ33004.1 PAS domain S-box [Hoeflea phototrophica DFL-43]